MKHVTPGAGSFFPRGHNLNKLGRGPLGDATYQLLWFQTRRLFHAFPLYDYVKDVTLGRDHFWPQEHNLTNLVEVYWIMLHTKY